MASLIRMRLNDLCRSRQFQAGKPLDTAVPQDENLPTSSNHQHTTSWGVNIDKCTTV